MKASEYFMREGQACASTVDTTRLQLAIHRAPSRQARGWLMAGYYMQAGGYRTLIARFKAAPPDTYARGPQPWLPGGTVYVHGLGPIDGVRGSHGKW